MRTSKLMTLSVLVAAGFGLAACSGSTGPAGATGATGATGANGTNGTNGINGTNGTNGINGTNGTNGASGPGAGLEITIVSATAPATGPQTVTFNVTDGQGVAVDFLAELAAGAFGTTRGPRFSIVQAIPVAGAPAYEAGVYNTALYQTATAGDPAGAQTRPTSVPGTITLAQAAAFYVKNANGSYTYTFPTTAPALPTLAAGFPKAPVQTAQTLVAIQASRIFDGVTYPVGASFEFIPNGGAAVKRTVVSDAACNNCHEHMQAHGSRRTVDLCLTCHTPGWIIAADSATGRTANPIDFRQMIHQIHQGQTMVDPGAPARVYKWSATVDFSNVAFAPPNSVKNCTVCHEGGAQADAWKTNPNQAACSSCHTAHPGTTGAFPPDDECILCHKADVDSLAPSTAKVHSPFYDASTNTTFVGKTIEITINSVDVTTLTAATVTFTTKVNGVLADIKTNPLTSLRFTFAGPATDYGSDAVGGVPFNWYTNSGGYNQSAALGGTSGAASLTATGTAGQFRAPLGNVTNLNGFTMGVGVEAYFLETGTCVSAPPPAAACVPSTKEWPQKPTAMIYKKVGTGSAVARRTLVDNDKCNKCHEDLGFHGGEARKTPQYCATCHNAQNVNEERTSQFRVIPGTTTPFNKFPNTVQLSVMVHKIHKGSDLANEYCIGATRDFRGDALAVPPILPGEAPPVCFTGAYPGVLENCQGCHVAGGYNLPGTDVLPTRFVDFTCTQPVDPTVPTVPYANVCGASGTSTVPWGGGVTAPDTLAGNAFWTKVESFVQSGAANCGSCHDTAAASLHFQSMTIGGAETCTTCHGAGKAFNSIDVHVPAP
jgi:OmcA/MtrC family decaheme c-type cytochrome